jgi:hypothetical protein
VKWSRPSGAARGIDVTKGLVGKESLRGQDRLAPVQEATGGLVSMPGQHIMWRSADLRAIGLSAIVVEHENADRRRQAAILTPVIDCGEQIG